MASGVLHDLVGDLLGEIVSCKAVIQLKRLNDSTLVLKRVKEFQKKRTQVLRGLA